MVKNCSNIVVRYNQVGYIKVVSGLISDGRDGGDDDDNSNNNT